MQRATLYALAAAVGVFAWLGIAAPASAQACLDCIDISGFDPHHFFDDTTFEPMSDPHSEVHGGTCRDFHVECVAPEATADLPTLDHLVGLVEVADAAEISRLLAAHTTVITLNASRRAVQVLGCGRHVVAHIPVADDELLHSLTAAHPVATLADHVDASRD